MQSSIFHGVLVALGALSYASASLASTIGVSSQSFGVSTAFPASEVSCGKSTTGNFESCVSSRASTAFGGASSATATASADVVTGVLRASAFGLGSTASAEAPLSPNASVTVTETFTVNGEVTFGMAADGFWNTFRLGGGASATNNQAFVRVGTAQDGDIFTSSIGSFDDLYSVTINAIRPTSVSVSWQLIAQIVGGQGEVDFSNTGLLFVDAAPGASAIASNSMFLSNQQFGSDSNPSPVPVPASALFLIGGLAMLGGFLSLKQT